MISQYLVTCKASTMEAKDWIDLIGQALVCAGLVIAAIKYANEKKREFKKRFFEEQLVIYNEAVDNAAIIAAYDKGEAVYKAAVKDFKRLYWGKMCMVEDKKVESAMYSFNGLLDEYEAENDPSKVQDLKTALQQFGLKLAHTCRDSTLHTWDIKTRLEGFNDYTLENREKDRESKLKSSQ